MVDIIDKEPQESAKKEVVCRRGCGALLSYVQNDIKEYRGTDYGGGSDGQDTIECPNCGKTVILRSW